MSNINDPIVIVAAKRTPVGNLLGKLSQFTAPELGAHAHKAALEQAGISADALDEAFYGCVLQAGIGQAPARQSVILAGIPNSVGAVTINKMCGSGLESIMMAHDAIVAGSRNIMLAGGMESMTQAPYLLKKARQGYRLGHNQIFDHMFMDGLEDAYQKGKPMGHFAENTAKELGFTREQQDAFALASLNRSIEATEKGYFLEEISPLEATTGLVKQDEGVDPAKREKIARLKPVFSADGTITAANASSISDGAASVVLMKLSEAEKRGLTPLAKIVAHSTHAKSPEHFTIAPIGAIEKVLSKANWDKNSVDLFEINEAFAVVTMATMQALELPHDKVNVHGGACALGHPIGASGARILTTLLYALKQKQLKRGVATLCIGGGEAVAMGIEVY
jgi:acetyl-CoA C-acetyltransferase